ncbi:hypothetical protein AT727_05795 [Desulfitobacterium hafniense]|uniref:4Fe-4S ferredoxin-type domain-containing protein n=1 Tax=Desulfitobacterium hafniense TaxID=49338 RepID=A0A0W1JHY7_DESHA|nr:4Fe-4S binding protein [Desulfitobacterium hafniense]KTE91110.1 hypothetical protein AT727_05795 [Desulfitobacterium hafniense]
MINRVEGVYEKLRDRFNALGFGYAPTQSGVEFALLKRFFSPADARHMLEMPMDQFFAAEDYANISGRKEDEAAEILDDMSKRGLIFRTRPEGQPPQFRLMPVAHGLYEFNLNHVEPEWYEKNVQHFGESWGKQWYGAGIPFYRSVPIHNEVVMNNEVMPYDDAEQQIGRHTVFAVAPCICRITTEMGGGPADERREICLVFDEMAEFYIENGIGRKITLEEAVRIIRESRELGLVIQTANSKASEIMCSCSLVQCGILKAAKFFGGAATAYISHYRLVEDREKCRGCGVCVAKCPMQSITLTDGNIARADANCVACGQCVDRCPNQARILVKKPEADIRELPTTLYDCYVEMQQLRKESGQI